MKKILITLLVIVSSATAYADDNNGFWRGDVNGDKKVNVADLTHLIAILNNKEAQNKRMDVNNDNKCNMDDIQSLLDILLGNAKSTWQEFPKVINFEGIGSGEASKADDEQF